MEYPNRAGYFVNLNGVKLFVSSGGDPLFKLRNRYPRTDSVHRLHECEHGQSPNNFSAISLRAAAVCS